MLQKKNTKLGKNKFYFLTLILFFIFSTFTQSFSSSNLEGSYTIIKILDKISSKNDRIKLQNNNEIIFKDLSIKSMKCSNSEFDDNPEIKAYIQVKDLTNINKDNVFIFNGWMFSSSPSIKPFDHAVYDIWLIGCS
tara:strand:- start:1421 stop:1828 length:408 start_codon:yes stop_codon:yes gene_type:complete